MFEGIRKLWAEARADVVSRQAEARADVISKQVDDILQRYQRMNPNDRYWVFSIFNSVLSEVQDQLGSVAQWSTEQKKQIAKRIMLSSQKAFTTRDDNMAADTTQLSAYGGALLSLYLELLTLPGDQAARVSEAIENWRQINEGT